MRFSCEKVLSRDLEPLAVYRSDLPEAFSSLVMKMLEKAPEDRFDDMDAVYRSALKCGLVLVNPVQLRPSRVS